MHLRGLNVTTVSTGSIAGPVTLWAVNINTAGAGGILKIYNDVAATASELKATIDLGGQASLWYGIYLPKGLFYALSVAAADVTISYA